MEVEQLARKAAEELCTDDGKMKRIKELTALAEEAVLEAEEAKVRSRNPVSSSWVE